jgi:hypothetical protein
MAKERKQGRDAGTGKFIPKKEAERRPKTTVIETIPNRKPAKKGK